MGNLATSMYLLFACLASLESLSFNFGNGICTAQWTTQQAASSECRVANDFDQRLFIWALADWEAVRRHWLTFVFKFTQILLRWDNGTRAVGLCIAANAPKYALVLECTYAEVVGQVVALWVKPSSRNRHKAKQQRSILNVMYKCMYRWLGD